VINGEKKGEHCAKKGPRTGPTKARREGDVQRPFPAENRRKRRGGKKFWAKTSTPEAIDGKIEKREGGGGTMLGGFLGKERPTSATITNNKTGRRE